MNSFTELLIEIEGLPHCPRNRSHAIFKKGKASFLGKTEAAHSYENALVHHLVKYITACSNFKLFFNETKQHLVSNWKIFSPEVKTKEGRYSLTGTDLDAHKVLQDTIFKFIGIDDAFIVEDTRTKIQGDYKVILHLKIRDNDWDNGSELL